MLVFVVVRHGATSCVGLSEVMVVEGAVGGNEFFGGVEDWAKNGEDWAIGPDGENAKVRQ